MLAYTVNTTFLYPQEEYACEGEADMLGRLRSPKVHVEPIIELTDVEVLTNTTLSFTQALVLVNAAAGDGFENTSNVSETG